MNSNTVARVNTVAISADHDISVTDSIKKQSVGAKIGNACGSVMCTMLCGCSGPSQIGCDTLLHADYVERRMSSLGGAGSSRADIALAPAGSSRRIWIED